MDTAHVFFYHCDLSVVHATVLLFLTIDGHGANICCHLKIKIQEFFLSTTQTRVVL